MNKRPTVPAPGYFDIADDHAMTQNDTSLQSVPEEPRKWQAIALALLVHSLLFAALWYGLHWQSSAPANLETEVWDVQTRDAEVPSATKAGETAHVAETNDEAAVNADVALEQAREKVAATKQDAQSPATPDAQQHEGEALARQSADESKRTPADLAPSDSEDKEMSPEGRESYEDWRNLVAARVKAHIRFMVPNGFDTMAPVEFEVRLRVDGSIAGEPHQTQWSAVPGFDDTVRQAIKDTAPFPPDSLGRYHSLTLQFKPNDFKP
jgi:colicin import membrane protein